MIKAFTRRLGVSFGISFRALVTWAGEPRPWARSGSSKGLTSVCIKTHRRKRVDRTDPHSQQESKGVSERHHNDCDAP